MKKKTIILILIFFTTNVYAIKFENCYQANDLVAKKIDKIKPSSIEKKFKFLEKEEWEEIEIAEGLFAAEAVLKSPRTPEQEKLAEEYNQIKKKLLKQAKLDYKDKYRKKYYKHNRTHETDEWKLLTKSKTMQKTIIYTNEKVINDASTLERLGLSKINKYYVKISLVTKDYIEGNYIDERDRSLGDYYRFDLKKGTIIRSEDKNLTNFIDLKKCKLTGIKTSTYLDYWWAVILIMAITFFIFTQSGKRLKKIRRK